MTFDLAVLTAYVPALLHGFVDTIWLCVLSGALACALGIALTVGQRRGSRLLVVLIDGYVALTLALPLLVLLYVTFYVLPDFGLMLPASVVGVLTLAIYYAPYVAQVIQAAIDAVPAGTIEAGVAIGMSPLAIGRRIVAPQALPLLLPTLTGLMIGLFKDSALLSVISVHELMFTAKGVVSDTYAPLEVYFAVALVYWATTATLNHATRQWEHRLALAHGVALER
ncbi:MULTISPECIES: amino acid ABC transporter permease [Paraburkholderia]|jgi:polar amino acid transport system permease protein|uniref:amino acid ABC transporter permease n=1 Tax=Paraburkholderia TaxID=1822464 RepID=UPI000B34493B|nr:ABC transporter permease subunit [Paraburkholderia hospita]AXF04144.1 polar amino acid ABC transporter permease [Paraburkholderia hospita]OUL73798.1 polar amino acid ABC transporter permease [Paraburkholderia hospita]